MLNLYEAVRSNPSYSKLEIGGILFAEYNCGLTAKRVPNWTDTDYLVHIISGKKTWHTVDGIWRGKPGDTLFFKKGATIVEQHFEQSLCLLMLFIPDPLMRSTVREVREALGLSFETDKRGVPALRVENDLALTALFQSLRTYLTGSEKPPEPLIRLKLRELVVSVLSSGRNPELAAHFCRIGASEAPSVSEIMEANFCYNLSLEEYARLCHRSLSSFKREFQARFQESPGKWLLRRRLDHSARLLRGSEMNVTEAALASGFEDVSHFSRVFKDRFGVPPMTYRHDTPVAT